LDSKQKVIDWGGQKKYNHRSGNPSILEELPSGSSKGDEMVKSIHRQTYAEYLKEDSWRCSNSPTGAHYWLIDKGQMVCKYCSEARPVEKC
jgi:hypothetical protein